MPFPTVACACTYFFEYAAKKVGWSETYFKNEDNPVNCITDANYVLDKRKEILHADCKITYIRISNTSIPGDSVLLQPGVSGTVNVGSHPPVDPWSCLLTRNTYGTIKRGRSFLHGVTEDMFSPNGQWDLANFAATKFSDFGTALITTGMGLKYLVAAGPPKVYNFGNFTSIQPLRLATHQIGRPFGQPRGRR